MVGMDEIAKLIECLPEHLRERSRLVRPGSHDGGFILYWMASAIRTDENPALDVAIKLAESLDRQLLVYQALSPRYKFASDRHHAFIMQGAKDVQSQCVEAGVSYAFHLQTPEDEGIHLAKLANDAALVIVEDMPVDPQRRFLGALKRSCVTSIVAVDTACVVPMQIVGQAHTRAFKFRDRTKRMYAQRVTKSWAQMKSLAKPFDLQRLPFAPVDLQNSSIADLISKCDIDHAIGPVVDTVGGSARGYQRWESFKHKGLTHYHRKRNNPLTDGSSRMSAYLHYGMVSPMRIAREAAEIDNDGSQKYLDELLIWRELAYGFCFYRADHHRISAIPDWALATLRKHQADQRDHVYTWEQLARGQTESSFWNAMQWSLLRHGELHNNVRMTWGKAFLQWTPSPEDALRLMTDLNHRYALDGRDPSSYGGLLWCLGQFDRPFEPESNILGTVRTRSLADHGARLDVAAFRKKATAVRFEAPPKVAVVGAGISGLFAARTLKDHGVEVTVFEKSRGVGGRMATRRVNDTPTFDHGAQYFTCRDPKFKRYVDSWRQQSLVAAWPNPQQRIVVLENGMVKRESKSVDRWVAVPQMKTLCQHLGDKIPIETSKEVGGIKRFANEKQAWQLVDKTGIELGQFDKVIFALPADQICQITVDTACLNPLRQRLAEIKIKPCWALMLTLKSRIDGDWVGAFVHQSPIRWIARNGTKPGRPNDHEQVVIHADSDWSAERWDTAPIKITDQLIDAFADATGLDATAMDVVGATAHRWKYAIVDSATQYPKQRCYFTDDRSVIACGDWAGGARVEGAFLSGMATAGIVLGQMETKCSPTTQSLLF